MCIRDSPSPAPAGPTGPTSRQARVSESTRVTRPSNPRLLANPSHRRKRLLIYRRCRYLFIFPLLTYCRPRYIFFSQDGYRKRGVPEAEVVQNLQFNSTFNRYYASILYTVFGLYSAFFVESGKFLPTPPAFVAPVGGHPARILP